MLAALSHANGINSTNKGSDPFRWALTIVIGYQCVEKYAKYHNIKVPFNEFKKWVIENAELHEHDGDIDWLALAAGVYQEFFPEGWNKKTED